MDNKKIHMDIFDKKNQNKIGVIYEKDINNENGDVDIYCYEIWDEKQNKKVMRYTSCFEEYKMRPQTFSSDLTEYAKFCNEIEKNFNQNKQ